MEAIMKLSLSDLIFRVLTIDATRYIVIVPTVDDIPDIKETILSYLPQEEQSAIHVKPEQFIFKNTSKIVFVCPATIEEKLLGTRVSGYYSEVSLETHQSRLLELCGL